MIEFRGTNRKEMVYYGRLDYCAALHWSERHWEGRGAQDSTVLEVVCFITADLRDFVRPPALAL
jgi:hypothetical protein